MWCLLAKERLAQAVSHPGGQWGPFKISKCDAAQPKPLRTVQCELHTEQLGVVQAAAQDTVRLQTMEARTAQLQMLLTTKCKTYISTQRRTTWHNVIQTLQKCKFRPQVTAAHTLRDDTACQMDTGYHTRWSPCTVNCHYTFLWKRETKYCSVLQYNSFLLDSFHFTIFPFKTITSLKTIICIKPNSPFPWPQKVWYLSPELPICGEKCEPFLSSLP